MYIVIVNQVSKPFCIARIILNVMIMNRNISQLITYSILVATILFFANSSALSSDWTEVRTLEGKFTTLSQHFEKDKWTLVMLWTTDCGICQREYPIMSEFS